MYLHEKLEGNAMKDKAVRQPPFGGGFSKEQADQADALEIWASGFSDPGPDFCEVRLLKGGKVFATKTIDGY